MSFSSAVFYFIFSVVAFVLLILCPIQLFAWGYIEWMNMNEVLGIVVFFPEFLLLSGGEKLKNVSKVIAMWFTIVKWREVTTQWTKWFLRAFLLSWIQPSPGFGMLGKTRSISLWFDFDIEKKWGDDDCWRLLTRMLSYLPLSIFTCTHSLKIPLHESVAHSYTSCCAQHASCRISLQGCFHLVHWACRLDFSLQFLGVLMSRSQTYSTPSSTTAAFHTNFAI